MRLGRLPEYLSLIAFTCLLWLAACAPQPPLAVALHPWVGYEPLYLARDFKWLPDEIKLLESKTLGDLANRRIGFDRNAQGAPVFEKLLETAGLPTSAAIQVDLPPDSQLDAWHRHEVDTVITYEPIATAFSHEGARNLFDSRQMPDTIIDVLAVRRMLAAVTLPSLAANRASLGGGEPHLVRAAKALSALMARRGLLARGDDLAELIMLGILPSEEK